MYEAQNARDGVTFTLGKVRFGKPVQIELVTIFDQNSPQFTVSELHRFHPEGLRREPHN